VNDNLCSSTSTRKPCGVSKTDNASRSCQANGCGGHDAGHLRRGSNSIGGEDHREHRNDHVRASVANGDGAGLTGQKRDLRAFTGRPAPGHVEEPGGRIHPGHLGPTRGGKQRRTTGAAAEVDDPLTRPERRAVDDNPRRRQQLLRRALVPSKAPAQATRHGPVLGHVGERTRANKRTESIGLIDMTQVLVVGRPDSERPAGDVRERPSSRRRETFARSRLIPRSGGSTTRGACFVDGPAGRPTASICDERFDRRRATGVACVRTDTGPPSSDCGRRSGLHPPSGSCRYDGSTPCCRCRRSATAPVVFIHGASSSGTSWSGLVAELPDFRCLLVDRPGCGLSEPHGRRFDEVADLITFCDELVLDVFDALQLGRSFLVGTSFGSHVVLRASAEHGERVDKVVCLGWPMGAPVEYTPLSMRIASIPSLGALLFRLPATRIMVRAILKQVGLRDAFTDGRVSDVFVDSFRSLLNDTDTMTNELNQGPPIITPVKGFNDSILIPDDVLAPRCHARLLRWSPAATPCGSTTR
jgi:pimeloyl-ACP methyl ester carboxylesterase